MLTDPRWLEPTWDAPRGVFALQTRRGRGTGWGFNLADHVGAPSVEVAANRVQLRERLGDGVRIGWLRQVHGCRVVTLPGGEGAEADAIISREPGMYCAVLTADCLPVLLADRDGTVVAAAHAGWRGLAAGVLEATVAAMDVPPDRLCVWLGPRIGPRHFVVGPEVAEAFRQTQADADSAFLSVPGSDRFLADLGQLARLRLARLGVNSLQDSRLCTVEGAQDYFSYRRERVCGRMASLIGLLPDA